MMESVILFNETSFVSPPIYILFNHERAVADDTERVQMGAPLSAAEKLQAIPGELTNWLNELLKKYVLEEDTLTDHMVWDVSRGKPFQIIASMAYMCWYTDSRKAVVATDLKKWLERSEGVSSFITDEEMG